MRNKIENLGDYNTARIMVQQNGGKWSAVVKDIQLKVAPKYIKNGFLIGAPIGAITAFAIAMVYADRKTRKMRKEKELENGSKDTSIAENVIEDDSVEVSEDAIKQEEPPCS